MQSNQRDYNKKLENYTNDINNQKIQIEILQNQLNSFSQNTNFVGFYIFFIQL